MRFARSLFILAVASSISSIVMALEKDPRNPLTEEVMEELTHLQSQVSHLEGSVGDGLTNQMASLQLIHNGGTVPPVPSPHQASVSQMEIDGEVNQETLEATQIKARIRALLSKVYRYENLLAEEVQEVSNEILLKWGGKSNPLGRRKSGQSDEDFMRETSLESSTLKPLIARLEEIKKKREEIRDKKEEIKGLCARIRAIRLKQGRKRDKDEHTEGNNKRTRS